MKVQLLCFGVLQESLGRDHPLELAPSATVATLLVTLRTTSTVPANLWDTLAVAVNREYATLTTPLHDGDEVALLPPVSGGRS